MLAQQPHDLLPPASHDELARQQFVCSLKRYITRQIGPQLKATYENRVKPEFERQHQRSPQSHHELRNAIAREPAYQWWSALRRNAQELLWESVVPSVERHQPQLAEWWAKASQSNDSLGTVTIDPAFEVPHYQQVVDIHCMPGGYHSQDDDGDLAAGALYDRGVYFYAMGMLGPLNDDLGQAIVHNYLKARCPDFSPRRILDMGCSVGHSTLPYVDAFPDAEVWGIDIGAPMVRYAHGRAEALGKKAHFAQQNAEKMTFADGSFDLIVSHILLHEMPVPAIRRVMAECYRLLAPGGKAIHLEGMLYSHLDPFSALLYDWETANNNEPFWSALRGTDLSAIAREAGFERDRIEETFIAGGVWRQSLSNSSPNPQQQSGFGGRGKWFALTATK